MKRGIDVSSHQGAIDWGAVKTDFSILRAGWSWYQGGMTQDQRFLENVKGVREAGLPWGAYLYAYDKTPEAARASARKLGALLSGYQMEYPVAYDFEDPQYQQNTPEQNTAVCKAFLEELEGQGYYASLYTYANFAKSRLRMEELSRWDFWVAAYQSPLTSWTGSWGMWQYSAAGQVPGIQGNVDLDLARKDYPAIIRGAGLNGFGESPQQPEGCVPESGAETGGAAFPSPGQSSQALLAEYEALLARHNALVAAIRQALEAAG